MIGGRVSWSWYYQCWYGLAGIETRSDDDGDSTTEITSRTAGIVQVEQLGEADQVHGVFRFGIIALVRSLVS
jgi:hypothetical protein